MHERKKVLCPVEKNGKTRWVRVGAAFTNKDGSVNIYLDAYPTNPKLQIRELDERDRERQQSLDLGATGTDSNLPF